MNADTSELEAIGEDFSVSLSDLTFNSKPIITTLTMIAQENINAAPYITKAVEKRIEKAVPDHKLFAFYLLDSISKNVGSPYTLLFGQKLPQTFIQTYTRVDDYTRKRLIELFKTWKVAKTSSGLPLFPEEPINLIEQFLIKASTIYEKPTPQPRFSSVPPQQQAPSHQFQQLQFQPVNQQQQQFPIITSQMLLPTIDRLLALTTQRLQLTPGDEMIQQKISIINQLKVAIQAEQLSSQSLYSTKIQLDEMTRQEETLIRNTPPVRSPASAPPVPNLQNILQKVQPQPKLENNNGGKNLLGLGSLSALLNVKAPVKTPTPPVGKPDLSSLLSNLSKSGLIKAPSTTTNSTTSKSVPSTSLLGSLLARTAASNTRVPSPASASASASASSSFASSFSSSPSSSIVSELSQYDITTKFLTLDPSNTYMTLLIKAKPNKCGTCGKRFANDLEGQKKSRAHLDWHFRVNKKLKDGQGGMSRNWFLDDVEFVEFRDDEVIGSSGDDDKRKKEEELQREKEKSKERKYVVVPPDSDMNVVCGVCKEGLKAKFDDDLGEWIWDGAVLKNGKVFHDSCYTESTGGLSALLNVNKRTREEHKLDLGMLRNIVKNVKSEDGSMLKSS